MKLKPVTRALPILGLVLLVGVAFYIRLGNPPAEIVGSPRVNPGSEKKPAAGDPHPPSGNGSAASPSSVPQAPPKPDWALGSTIDFNDFFRREQVRRTSSIQLDWAYANAYATEAGSLGPSTGNAQEWLETTYAGRVYDQIRGGFTRTPGSDRPVYKLTRTAAGTLYLRKEMTPLPLWILATIRGGEQLDLPTRELATRIRNALRVKVYHPRPGQNLRSRDQTPDAFQALGGRYANTERRWLPEMGGPGVIFDETDIVTVKAAQVYPPDCDELMVHHPDRNLSHSPQAADQVDLPFKSLSANSGFFVAVTVEVAWDRVSDYPYLVAIQPSLDVERLGIPSLAGYALPDPKEIFLAGSKGEEDSYVAMMSKARSHEVEGSLDRARAEYEKMLVRWPRALEVYMWLDRSYESSRDYAAWAAVCSRAIEACRNPDVDLPLGWDGGLKNLPRAQRVERMKVLAAKELDHWQKRLEEIRELSARAQTPK